MVVVAAAPTTTTNNNNKDCASGSSVFQRQAPAAVSKAPPRSKVFDLRARSDFLGAP